MSINDILAEMTRFRQRDHLELQYQRLVKHRDLAVEKLDEVHLLDLAQSLRIFCDMKQKVDERCASKGLVPDYAHAIKNKKSYKIIKRHAKVYAAFVTGVPELSVMMKDFLESYRLPSQSDRDYLHQHPVTSGVQRLNSLQDWLGAGVIEVYEDSPRERIDISREMLIRRVANTLGGSHPSSSDDNTKENRFDKYVKYLNSLTVGIYPMHYYQLLEIANELIRVLGPVFLSSGNSNDS